ncbi:MAG: hypothetical protein ACFE0O_14350 [Opitutales bacterium]
MSDSIKLVAVTIVFTAFILVGDYLLTREIEKAFSPGAEDTAASRPADDRQRAIAAPPAGPVSGQPGAGQAVTLEDRKGRSLQVVVLAATASAVHFERTQDGRRFWYPLDQLTPESVSLVAQQARRKQGPVGDT